MTINEILNWEIWSWLSLVPATPTATGEIFSLSDYLATLALLIVVVTVSEFRYRYRLAMHPYRVRSIAFWLALTVGVLIIGVDVWFSSQLPIPKLMNNKIILKSILGTIFLIMIFYTIYLLYIRKMTFTKWNAKRFHIENLHCIHEGNPDQLQVVAQELTGTLADIFDFAELLNPKPNRGLSVRETRAAEYAHDFLLLIADQRFCRLIVERAPIFAVLCFKEAQDRDADFPITAFSRNIGQEFIRNTTSVFYQESSGWESGALGEIKLTTRTIFGSYRFIEWCHGKGSMPLDVDFDEFRNMNERQIKGYSRACLAFFESYLISTKGSHFSSTVAQILHNYESLVGDVYQLEGEERPTWQMKEYMHLREAVDLIQNALGLLDAHSVPHGTLKIRTGHQGTIYDQLAELAFNIVLSSSSVTSPVWTCWEVQHNSVWSKLTWRTDRSGDRVLAHKLRRLMYDEIRRMDEFPNFKGARIIGYCLNVLGLSPEFRRRGYRKEDYPLEAATLVWVKKNYEKIRFNNPKVADSCLHGSITYDVKTRSFVKTYSNETRRDPSQDFFQVDPYDPTSDCQNN